VRTQTPKESALSERKRYEWKMNDDDNDTDKTMNGEGSQHDEVSEKNEGRMKKNEHKRSDDGDDEMRVTVTTESLSEIVHALKLQMSTLSDLSQM
jgi:hypothetical protein